MSRDRQSREERPPDNDRRAALALMTVSRETEERLALLVELLRRWQTIKNLVAPSTLDSIWMRHIADSAQLAPLCPDARHWVDLGSGAGFPGLVVALMIRERPGAHVDLIESNARKGAFLREAARATGAPAQIHVARIEEIVPSLQRPVDVVTSRALAPLPELVAMSHSLLDEGATGLFLAGDEARTIDLASDHLQVRAIPSLTKAASRIVVVQRVNRSD